MRSAFRFLVVASVFALPVQRAAAQDAAAGQSVFKAQCSICHSVTPGRTLTGPSLAGLIGRTAGTLPGFNYSEANKKSGIVWTAATLDPYLASPLKAIPGTRMTYPGLKDSKQRADLIAYLATLH